MLPAFLKFKPPEGHVSGEGPDDILKPDLSAKHMRELQKKHVDQSHDPDAILEPTFGQTKRKPPTKTSASSGMETLDSPLIDTRRPFAAARRTNILGLMEIEGGCFGGESSEENLKGL